MNRKSDVGASERYENEFLSRSRYSVQGKEKENKSPIRGIMKSRVSESPMKKHSGSSDIVHGQCSSVVGVEVPRHVRAKSEKREILSDTWFARTFATAKNDQTDELASINAEPVMNHLSPPPFGESTCERAWSPSISSFSERKRAFENLINKSGGIKTPDQVESERQYHKQDELSQFLSHDPVVSKEKGRVSPYQGEVGPKSSPVSSVPDWDFLTQLNDILRKENFLDDNSCTTQLRDSTVDVDSVSSSNNNNSSSWTLSPKPPRPLRRVERRKDYAKARSMDAGQWLDFRTDASLQVPSAPPPTARCFSPGIQSDYHFPPTTDVVRGCSDTAHCNQHLTPTRLVDLPIPPLSRSPGQQAMSSSLDSIYEKLRSTECPSSNNYPRPVTQFYSGTNNHPSSRGYPLYRNFGGGSGNMLHPGYVNSNLTNYYNSGSSHPNLNEVGVPFCGGNATSAYGNSPLDLPEYRNYSGSFNNVRSPGTWIMPNYRSRSYNSFKGSLVGLDYEDRLLRLESDKDTLHLQVSVLSDQIEAQTAKIQDLEKMLDDKRNILETTSDQLQRELLSRSSLETQKLALMTEISSLRLKHASLERENTELKDRVAGRSTTDLNQFESRIWDKPPLAPMTPPGSLLMGPVRFESPMVNNGHLRTRTPPANACRRVDDASFGTLPRRSLHSNQVSAFSFDGGTPRDFQGHCSKISSLSSGNLTSSNGGGIERRDWNVHTGLTSPETAIMNPKQKSSGGHKSRGILRLLGKLRRSNSGGLDNDNVAPENSGPFVRGGYRATAQPRLGWAKESSALPKPVGPVTSWNSEGVIMWLNCLGLEDYAGEVKRCVKTGQQLLDASKEELEKQLGLKNELHKKKLGLAIYSLRHPEEEDSAGKLDYHWVTRWLDDVGLPQYKELFSEARIDGRTLSQITQEDLISLKITSSMHHASIKRGIQLLRIHNFQPGCLCRRGGENAASRPVGVPGESSNGNTTRLQDENIKSLTKSYWDPQHVATWTNHRVMEWLKVIDLAEYAPNLRGSGVHGALMIFEPKFNANLLATLLAIPGNKTLLRRHLNLQFNELVGRIIMQEKRTIETAPDFIPMNPTAKVKTAKKKQFPLRTKRSSTPSTTSEELLCPAELFVFPFKELE